MRGSSWPGYPQKSLPFAVSLAQTLLASVDPVPATKYYFISMVWRISVVLSGGLMNNPG
jgi:hypothetical protein